MSASDRLLGASGPNRSALGRVLRLIPFDEPVQLAITVVVVLLALWLVLYPLGWLIWAMFHKGAPGASGDWTTENLKVLLDAEYWQLVGRSLIVGVGTTLLATFIGVPLAWVTVKTDMPGKRFVEIIAILPFFTSTFIGALAWIFLGNPTNGLLKLWLGIPINVYSMGGIIWVTGLYMAPYIYLFASAALRNMDTSYEEASFMAGAGLFRTLTRVTFPLIFPALMSGMSLVSGDLPRYLWRRRHSRISGPHLSPCHERFCKCIPSASGIWKSSCRRINSDYHRGIAPLFAEPLSKQALLYRRQRTGFSCETLLIRTLDARGCSGVLSLSTHCSASAIARAHQGELPGLSDPLFSGVHAGQLGSLLRQRRSGESAPPFVLLVDLWCDADGDFYGRGRVHRSSHASSGT